MRYWKLRRNNGCVSTSAERMRRLRARRAALLEAVPCTDDPAAVAGSIRAAVESSIAALEIGESDAAVAQLASLYAQTIDEAKSPAYATRWIGPLLQDALSSLGATPPARAPMRAPEPIRPATSQLELLHRSRPGLSSK
jgi:hypothetical protein